MRFGVQGFGTFRNTSEDFGELFYRILEAGYQLIEPCVSFMTIEGYERTIWPYETFKSLAAMIDSAGLKMESCHVFSGNLLANVPQMTEMAEQYGIRQFVVKTPQDMSERSLQETSLRFMQIADALEPAGARLLIHNEADDIAAKIHGRTVYEYLLDLCLGKVDAQVDVGWAMFAGEDPVSLLWRNKDRVRSLHYKDFAAADENNAHGAPYGTEVQIGKGALPMEGCFQFARTFGIAQIGDQDSFADDVVTELKETAIVLNMLGQSREHSISYLNTYDIETGEIKTLHRFERVVEAPNWLKKEDAMLYNSDGRIWHYDIVSDTETLVDTGICTGCNNDHVVAPDESAFAVSHGGVTPEEGYTSRIYTIPMGGGEAKLITPNTPSYLHGWSPDGKELAYCAFRPIDGKMEVDIYTIPADGSAEEKRLTGGGFNDGPEYSPDGKYIWFNSTRSGLMQVYRMKADGSEQTQMTGNDRNNWFGHVSPDGKKVVYLSYRKGDLDAGEHLPNMQVELWVMNSDGSDKRRAVSLFGGQGSINVNSWAGDSKRFAFVSYELIHE